MKPPFKQRHPLFRPLASMTISIFVLLLLSYFFIISSSNQLKLNAAVIKIIAMQRSLSQQIINSVAADNLEGQISGLPLESLIHSFSGLEHMLLYGNENLKVAPLKKDLIPEYHKLNDSYIYFIRQLNGNISNNGTGNLLGLLNAENLYLVQQDNFSTSLNGYSNEEVKNFQLKEICILCISIIIVFMEIRFIFFPAIKKIENQSTALREISFNQAHIIRRPLANIQGLLTMILDTRKQDQLSIDLITLARKEADELDTVIKKNVYKSDKNYNINV